MESYPSMTLVHMYESLAFVILSHLLERASFNWTGRLQPALAPDNLNHRVNIFTRFENPNHLLAWNCKGEPYRARCIVELVDIQLKLLLFATPMASPSAVKSNFSSCVSSSLGTYGASTDAVHYTARVMPSH